jgi:hypothetical protein
MAFVSCTKSFKDKYLNDVYGQVDATLLQKYLNDVYGQVDTLLW